MNIIILVIILIIIAICYFFIRDGPNKQSKQNYNELFEQVLLGKLPVEEWSKYLGTGAGARGPPRRMPCGAWGVLGENRFREAELLAERLPEGKILIAKEINQVWIGNRLFYIQPNKDYLRGRNRKLAWAIQRNFSRALRSPRALFVFPSFLTEREVKYMNPIQRVKQREWKNGITLLMNKKLFESRRKANSVVRSNYLTNTQEYLEKNHLHREQVLPQAVKLFLARAENRNRQVGEDLSVQDNAAIDRIADELQEQRAENHAHRVANALANAAGNPRDQQGFMYAAVPLNGEPVLMMGDIQDNDVPMPEYNAAGWQNPRVAARQGNANLGGGLQNRFAVAAAPAYLGDVVPQDETIAQRVNRRRKAENKANATFSQSVHDAVASAQVREAVRDHVKHEGNHIDQVGRLARDFNRLYPEMASKHGSFFSIDGEKDYLKSFAAIVYDERNDSVRSNLIEALGMEMDNIAPFCDEGRKNKTWALLQGIDKTGYGAPVASRVEVIDALMHEFGRVTDVVGLTVAEMISRSEEFAKDFKVKYPYLQSEIDKKFEETKFVIEDLYDDEVNLYGSTDTPVSVMAIQGGSEGFTVLGESDGIYPSGIVNENFVGDWSDQIGSGVASGTNFGEAQPSMVFADLIPQERTLASPGNYRLDPGTADGTGAVFGISLGDAGVSFPDMSEGIPTRTYVNETEGGGGYYGGFSNSLPRDVGNFADNGLQGLIGNSDGFTPTQEAEILLDTDYGSGTLFSGTPIRFPGSEVYNPNGVGKSVIYSLPSGLTMIDAVAPPPAGSTDGFPTLGGYTSVGTDGIEGNQTFSSGGSQGFSVDAISTFVPPVASLTPVDLSGVVNTVPGSVMGSPEAIVEFM